jgi:hypothetical protein
VNEQEIKQYLKTIGIHNCNVGDEIILYNRRQNWFVRMIKKIFRNKPTTYTVNAVSQTTIDIKGLNRFRTQTPCLNLIIPDDMKHEGPPSMAQERNAVRKHELTILKDGTEIIVEADHSTVNFYRKDDNENN